VFGYESIEDSFLIDIMGQINESLLMNYTSSLVTIGPRFTGTESCQLAADYLYDTFTTMGLWTTREQWTYKGYTSENIYATINGSDQRTDGIVVLCAHYDTARLSPGATDNAVGVATVLAAAEILRYYSFDYTLRFIAFSGEEIGLFGSYSHVKNAYQRDEHIIAVLNVDENGYASPEHEDTFYLQHPSRSQWITAIVKDLCTQYPNLIGLTVTEQPYYAYSDHAAFHAYGYDTCFFLSIDWNVPWVHTAEDTLDKINPEFHIKTSRLSIASMATIGLMIQPMEVSITAPNESTLYSFNTIQYQLELWGARHISRIAPTILLGSHTVEVTVQSYNETILSVQFLLDDVLMCTDETLPFEWYMSFETSFIKSSAQLQVIATSETGETAQDSMDVTIIIL